MATFENRFRGFKEDIRPCFESLLTSQAAGVISLCKILHPEDKNAQRTAQSNFNWVLSTIQDDLSMKTFNSVTRPNIVEECKLTSKAAVIDDYVSKLEARYVEQGERKTTKKEVAFEEADYFSSVV